MSDYLVKTPVPYIPKGKEIEVALACMKRQYPLMLRGPTGCGKTTLVRHLAYREKLPLVSITCTEDTDPADFIGRNTLNGWVDGKATTAFRMKDGAIFYVDELGEGRQDTMTVLHSMTDDRRELENPVRNEVITAPEKLFVVASYNPGYQLQNKVKPSTAQRFVTIDIDFPPSSEEGEMVKAYLGKPYKTADSKTASALKKTDSAPYLDKLLGLAGDYRKMAQNRDSGLREGPGTRLIGRTAGLIEEGIDLETAIQTALINPLTHKADVKKALLEAAKNRLKFK